MHDDVPPIFCFNIPSIQLETNSFSSLDVRKEDDCAN